MSDTKEPQYQPLVDLKRARGLTRLGLMNNQVWQDDPKRLLFTLSRYKFVAKLFSGRKRVLEAGCGDAFCSRIVKQEVQHLTVVDFDPVFIEDVRERADPAWPIEAKVHDLLAGPVEGRFDGIYSIDVLEHIPSREEDRFVSNLVASLEPEGALIAGMPSLESQAHASPQSKEGHVNCKTGRDLKNFMERHFHNVFLFSMNDEVVHTGYFPMAHYLLAVCTLPRKGSP
ncbi:MAG TPA: class I SAM-dependent methyltransferase [Planctomycetota bacterium]|nr:class I SAM-dependent methyltransferase [Planctomycetota bacterium]